MILDHKDHIMQLVIKAGNSFDVKTLGQPSVLEASKRQDTEFWTMPSTASQPAPRAMGHCRVARVPYLYTEIAIVRVKFEEKKI